MKNIFVFVLLALAVTPFSVSAARPMSVASSFVESARSALRATWTKNPNEEAPDASPWFCHSLDCPKFKTTKNNAKYETRLYPPGLKWVSTVVTGVKYDAAVSQGFMRLFHYIQGANSDSAHIPMTAPVRVTLTPGDGPFCENNFTVSFFVPYDGDGVSTTQIDPPEPTDPEVFIDEDPDGFVAFVRAFGGWTNEEKLIAQAETLGEDLESDGLDDVGDREHFVFAGYDSPFRIFRRHNEVWFLAPYPEEVTKN